MKKIKATFLLHPVFVISLFVFITNDFYWKYTYANWLTGKLSDVAGLIVLPLLLREILLNNFGRWIMQITRVSIEIFYSGRSVSYIKNILKDYSIKIPAASS